MKMQRLLVGLTILNLILLTVILLSGSAQYVATSPAPVLRARSLEIVDDGGRVRASIKVQPAETFEPTGRKYPETVVLRLIDPNGRPEVKIGASVEGGGLSLVGSSDETRILLEAAGARSSLRLTAKSGQRLIEP